MTERKKSKHTLNEPTKCTQCGRIFPWSPEYFKTVGLRTEGCSQPCKDCSSHNSKVYRDAHKEQVKAVIRKWRNEHKEYKAEKAKEWFAAHAERKKETERIWKEAHKEEVRTAKKQWKKDHPIKNRLDCHKRRVRLKRNMGICTPEDIYLQYKGQKGRCWWCKGKLNGKYHIDHRIPLAKGGIHDRSNIVLACQYCNQSKHAKTPQEFAGRLS